MEGHEGGHWAVLALQGLRCWRLQDLAQSGANPAQTSQEQTCQRQPWREDPLDHQIAQGVVEQEKGFGGFQCWVSRSWESIELEQEKGSHKGHSPWGGQVGLC